MFTICLRSVNGKITESDEEEYIQLAVKEQTTVNPQPNLGESSYSAKTFLEEPFENICRLS